MRTPFSLLVVLLAVLTPGRDAWASDGLIEINQAKALAGSVVSGDAPGFPVTLSQPGSYLLTSNLNAPSGASGIVLSTFVQGIVLDLGGFEIAGAGSCSSSGASLVCDTGAGGAGNGVESNTAPVRVKNGRVRGFGARGIFLPVGRSQVENVRVEENVGDGIYVGEGSIVSDSVAGRNGGSGIVVVGSVVERCAARGNRLSGMRGLTGTGNSFLGNAVNANGQIGIDAGSNSVVRNNAVTFNTTDGIVVHRGSLVSDNVSSSNGAAGIAALSTSSVQRNIVNSNTGIGLYLFPESGGTASPYFDNVVTGNGGTVVNGINMGGNSCNGTGTCP